MTPPFIAGWRFILHNVIYETSVDRNVVKQHVCVLEWFILYLVMRMLLGVCVCVCNNHVDKRKLLLQSVTGSASKLSKLKPVDVAAS